MRRHLANRRRHRERRQAPDVSPAALGIALGLGALAYFLSDKDTRRQLLGVLVGKLKAPTAPAGEGAVATDVGQVVDVKAESSRRVDETPALPAGDVAGGVTKDAQ